MKPISIVAVWAVLCMAVSTKAQTKIDRNSFQKLDKYVADLGPMEGHYLKYIVDTLTRRGTIPKVDQVRAMYMWEANNISYNTAARRHPKQANNSASETLNERSGSHEGYANLFKTMCDLAHIRCEVIPGMAKFDPRDIGKLNPKWNRHTWNAVMIDNTWYLLDLAWSAGYTDRKFRFFTPSFTDAWFFTDRELFALSHYPDKKNWQLLDTPLNKSNFTYAPIIGKSAIIYEVYPETIRGNIRGKSDTTKKMIFEVGNPDLIKSISVTRRTAKKLDVKYTIEGDLLYADIPFASTGEYSFDIYVNDELAYIYQADISKGKKKPVPRKQTASMGKSNTKADVQKAKAQEKQVAAREAAAAKRAKALEKADMAKQEAAEKRAKAKEKADMARQEVADKKIKEKEKAERAKQEAEEKKVRAKEKEERAKQEAEAKAAEKEARAKEKEAEKAEKKKK
jgi:hypothetical protein